VRQEDEFEADWNIPSGHNTQEDIPEDEYEPAGQELQFEASGRALNAPSKQLEHAVDPGREAKVEG